VLGNGNVCLEARYLPEEWQMQKLVTNSHAIGCLLRREVQTYSGQNRVSIKTGSLAVTKVHWTLRFQD
jgi:hypothetical protein